VTYNPTGSAQFLLHPRAESARWAILVRAGSRSFAFPLEQCREVVEPRPYVPLPGSEPWVCGLMNVRGRPVTILDFSHWLGHARARDDPSHSVVIAEHGQATVGFAVEEVLRIGTVEVTGSTADAENVRAGLAGRAFAPAEEPGGVPVGAYVNLDVVFRHLLA
jgi:chemotaxis signal transduction protein